MSMIKRNFARLIGILVIGTCSGMVTTVYGFPQANSAVDISTARGVVYDVTEDDWVLNGDWELRCGGACIDTEPANIDFDLSIVMVRPDGADSHSHTFDNFIASSVSESDNTLTIEGTIEGTGAVGGLTDITITIVDVGGADTSSIAFPGNGHILGDVGGVVVRSR